MKTSLIAATLVLASLPVYAVTGTGEITHVVDGDTFWVKADRMEDFRDVVKDADSGNFRVRDKTFKVRLLNVNTEESVHRTESKNTAFGKETSEVVKARFSDAKVTFDCDGVGYYKRPLCSVKTDNGDIGKFLIENGYSPYVTRYGRHPTLDRAYTSAELEAKRERLGVWR